MVRKARSKNKPKTAGHAAATREHGDDEEATLRLLEQFLTSIARESYADQDLVVATLNIAHLKDHKLTLLLHYMRAYHVDVLCLQDVCLSPEQATFFKRRVTAALGAGTLVKASILSPHPDPPALRQSNRVGGQFIIVQPRWGRRHASSWVDDSGLGLAMGIEFLTARQTRIHLVSTYWPIPNANGELDTLWSRATSWMARARKHGSPLTYVQDLVKAKLHTALSHEGTSNILVGDLNASRVGNGGTHGRLADWMSEAILSSGVTEEIERNLQLIHTLVRPIKTHRPH